MATNARATAVSSPKIPEHGENKPGQIRFAGDPRLQRPRKDDGVGNFPEVPARALRPDTGRGPLPRRSQLMDNGWCMGMHWDDEPLRPRARRSRPRIQATRSRTRTRTTTRTKGWFMERGCCAAEITETHVPRANGARICDNRFSFGGCGDELPPGHSDGV